MSQAPVVTHDTGPVAAGPVDVRVLVDRVLVRLRDLAAERRARGRGTAGVAGLTVADADVAHALGRLDPAGAAAAGATAAGAAATSPPSRHELGARRLERLRTTMGLAEVDLELLAVAMAPELDPEAETLIGYLADDLTARRPTVALALAVLDADPTDPLLRGRLHAGAPLLATGVLALTDGERPFLSRRLRVADRVVGHLLGDDQPDPDVARVEVRPPPLADTAQAERLAAMVGVGARLVHLRELPGAAATATAVSAMDALGTPATALECRGLGAPALEQVLPAGLLEARLRGGPLVIGPVEHLEDLLPGAVAELVAADWPLVLVGARTWDAEWCREMPVCLDVAPPTARSLGELWRALLPLEDGDPARVAAGLRLPPDDVARVAGAAHLLASAQDREPRAGDLVEVFAGLGGGALERMAVRVRPTARMDDLVLPDRSARRVRELPERLRNGRKVLDEWGLRTAGRQGDGLTALFAGPPGTGKTMAAEAVAHELGLDLWVIDLSSVVDKYIGETEKHLERVFRAAESRPGVLLFDEADALFGKRSGVSDARDRYANVEVSYLLQRIDRFDGLAILTTNLRSNLDEAFARRLDLLVDFPEPDVEQRRQLWAQCLGDRVPLASDVDLDYLAEHFEISGGHIRTACLSAAHGGAMRGEEVDMVDLLHGLVREYEKIGRMCSEAEFGPYFEWVEHA